MKLIPLSQGKFAQVDDEDYDWLNKKKWHAHFDGVNWYAKTSFKKKENYPTRVTSVHRYILCILDPKIRTDHKDRNGLNNQRNNIRIASATQNNANKCSLGKSKYLGVSQFHEKTSTGKWRARLSHEFKHYYLGQFDTEEAAARAYDAKAKELHGEFANLNFPEE